MHLKVLLILFFNLIISALAVSAQQTKLNWLADAKSYLNGGFINVSDAVEDLNNSIVVIGNFQRNTDFDPGPDTFNLTAVSDYDIFIAKYTKAGKLLYAYSFGGLNNEVIESADAITADGQGNIYVTGTFGKTIDFNPGPGKAILSAPYGNEIFVVSFDVNGQFRFAKSIAENARNSENVQRGKSIAVDEAHNIYVAGTFAGKDIDFDPGAGKALFTAQGKQDVFFSKYDQDGIYIFNKVIEGNKFDELSKLQLDHNGNIIICGNFGSYKNDFDPGPATSQLTLMGDQDMFFAKYDANGNYIFAHNVGRGVYSNAASVAVANDNSLIVVGVYSGKNVDFDPGTEKHTLTSAGLRDVFVARYNKDGNYIFAFGLGNTSYDECYDVAISSKDNFGIIGEIPYGKNIDFDPRPDSSYIVPGYINAYFATYTINGEIIAAKALSTFAFKPLCITVNNKEDFTAAGVTYGGFDSTIDGKRFHNYYDAFVSVLSKQADLINAFATNNYANYYGSSTEIIATATDSKGNIYTCGNFEGRVDIDPGPGMYIIESLADNLNSGFFARYSANGKLVYAKVLRRTDAIHDIAVDVNENVYLTGGAGDSSDFDPSDKIFRLPFFYSYFIAKYDDKGNFIYAKGEKVDYPDNNNFKSIAIDKNGDLCVAGYFDKIVDFDPSSAVDTLRALGRQDIFIAKYTSSGNLVFVKQIGGGNSYCYVTGLELTSDNGFAIAGKFYGRYADFNPGKATFILDGNKTEGYIATYTTNGALKTAFGFETLKPGYFDFYITAFTVDASDNMYIGGASFGTFDFDPGADIFQVAANDNYFASYTNTGKLRYERNFKTIKGGNYENVIDAITTDNLKNIYVATSFTSKMVDINAGFDSVIIINESFNDSILANLDAELLIAVYDSTGAYITNYNYNLDSAAGDNFISSVFVSNNNLIVAGYGQSKIDFDPSVNTNYLVPTCEFRNLFLASYSLPSNTFHQTAPIALLLKKNYISGNYK